MQYTHLIRTVALLLIGCSFLSNRKAVSEHAPLNPGCITSGEQWVLIGTLPAPITATSATDGACSGNYQYQWQVSYDNINFTDIPGATGQNLSFTTTPAQTAWYQRKVTCGADVCYTGSVKVNMVAVLYFNDAVSGSFTRNNCGGTGVGFSITYTVPAHTYASPISVLDANAKAQADVDANGQAYANANANATCIWTNVERSQTFTKSNCPEDATGTIVHYTVPASKYSSTVSQADADQQAQNDIDANGQAYANRVGRCFVPIPGISITLKNSYSTGNPIMVEFLQNGQAVSTGNIPGTYNASETVSVPPGTYKLRFTSSTFRGNYMLSPGGLGWAYVGLTTTSTEDLTFSTGGSYTISSVLNLP